MNRREQLISKTLSPSMDEKEVKMLDTTMRLILGDMGEMYAQFWSTEGPGVMCFQPESKERSMFYMTLEELHSAQSSCESDNQEDLAESFRRILEAAQKIDPVEKAGYIINDAEGIRYLEIDYNKGIDK
jgi:hypothetical protein